MLSNPLRDSRDRRIPRVAGPCVLVMFGVTGDLASKKLLPAVYDLANRGLLPPGFSLVGFARRDWVDEDFAQVAYNAVKLHARTPFRDAVWQQMLEGVRFVSGEFADDEAFDNLAKTVSELDQSRGTGGNYAFYLSVPPKAFPLVVRQLKRSGLSDPGGPVAGRQPWRRVVIEKPFGHDLASARELNAIQRPSSESEASAEGPEPGPPPIFRLSRRVVPGGGGRAAFGASGVTGGATAARPGRAWRAGSTRPRLASTPTDDRTEAGVAAMTGAAAMGRLSATATTARARRCIRAARSPRT